jgi:hypothetical protein
MTFGPDTSVGIGSIMELFVNFGSIGVWIGMAMFGAALVLIDERAAFHLAHGDVRRCCLWFVPGLSLLQVGGSLVDVSLTAGAGLAVAVLANSSLRWLFPHSTDMLADAPAHDLTVGNEVR